MLFKNLPLKTQLEVKQTLKAYSRVSVEKNNLTGEYETTNVVSLTYEKSEKSFIAQFQQGEIYNIKERVLNYVNTFREYPYRAGKNCEIHYKGFKNWSGLRENWKNAEYNENGDIIFI